MNDDVVGWFVTHAGFEAFGESEGFRGVYREDGPCRDGNPERPSRFLRNVAGGGEGCVMLIHSYYTDEWIEWAKRRGLTPVVVSRQVGNDGPNGDGQNVWWLYGERNETLRKILAAKTCERIEELLAQRDEDLVPESLLGKGNQFLEEMGEQPIDLPEGNDGSTMNARVHTLRRQIGRIAKGMGHMTHVFQYSRRDDFKALWGIGSAVSGAGDTAVDGVARESLASTLHGLGYAEPLPREAAPHVTGQRERRGATIVIIWDGMPDDDDPHQLSVQSFVTPYDWARIASHCIYGEESLEHCRLRFLILDLRPAPGRSEHGPLWGEHGAVPWIQDYLAKGNGEATSKLRRMVHDLRGSEGMFAKVRQSHPIVARDWGILLEDVANPDRVRTTRAPDDDLGGVGGIEALLRQWKRRVRAEENRHSAANLIGPMVMAEALPPHAGARARQAVEGASLSRRALVVALRQLRMMPRNDVRSLVGIASRGPEDGVPHDLFDRRRRLTFHLVDDHCHLGYGHCLATLMFGSGYQKEEGRPFVFRGGGHKLVCEATPDGILRYLCDTFPSISDWQQPRVFGLCDVLLLDLRLWPPGDSGTCRNVLAKAVNATNTVFGCTETNKQMQEVAPGLATAFSAAQSVVLDDGNLRGRYEALALLPLLLSAVDRTLPIIVFSSTRQRKVTELMEDTPNIIRSFIKPSIGGVAEKDVMTDLSDALSTALEVHELRVVWRRIARLEAKAMMWEALDSAQRFLGTASVGFHERNRELRATIGELFEGSLYGESRLEEIGKPWMLLEKMVRSHFRNSPFTVRPTKPRLKGPNAVRARRRASAATSLKRNRNAQVHGEFSDDLFGNERLTSRVLCLQLLFLVNLLEDCGSDFRAPRPDRAACSIGGKDGGPRQVIRALVGTAHQAACGLDTVTLGALARLSSAMDDEKLAELAARERVKVEEEEEKERVRRRAEEKRAVWLDSLTPVGRDIEELIAGHGSKGMPEVTFVMKEVKAGRWSGEDRTEAARWLRDRMMQDKVWREVSFKKNPSKDRNYQRTRDVMKWLGES